MFDYIASVSGISTSILGSGFNLTLEMLRKKKHVPLIGGGLEVKSTRVQWL